MQNLIQLEDDVKGLPDQALQQLAKAPNPQVPQFLVISEIQRRGDMRKRFEARQQQQPQGTVAQQIVNPQPQGIASMMPQQGMPQGGPMPMPQGGPMPQPPMGQPMPQAPMQQPMPQPMAPQGMATGGVIRMAEGRMATFPIDQAPAQSSIIGQRINNPFNIRQYNQGFVGETGTEDGFISFEDPMYGVRAADRVLTTYGRDRDIGSIRGLVSRFAPPSENETQSYIDYISGQLGIDPDAEIDLSDPAMRSRILAPMAKIESRTEYTPDQITGMIEQANLRQGDSGQTQFPTPTPNIVASAQPPQGMLGDFPLPQMREGVVTTESMNLPVLGQEPPLPEGLVEGMLDQSRFDRMQRSAKQTAEGRAVEGPQTTTELMTGIFGGRQTPEVGEIIRQSRVSTLPELENALPLVARRPTRKQAEAGDVIRMAENTKVDPKGLITTDNNPVSAIIEDAAKGEAEVQQVLSGRSGVGMGGVGGDMKQLLEGQAPSGRPGTGMGGVGADMKRILEQQRLEEERTSGEVVEDDEPMSDAQKALIYGGSPFGGMALARREEKDRTQRPEGTFAEERISKEAQINMRAIEAIQTKQAELQEYIATHDTTDPAVKKEVRRRESQLSELNTRLSQFNQPEKKGGSDATVVDTDAAEQDQTATEAATETVTETAPDADAAEAQKSAERYIQQVRAAREAGLISKEELAKKEALGAALIQLGAGIAKGDLAEGLSKAGVAAQDVREKARDRAVRADYYEYLKSKPASLTASGQNYSRLQKVVADQLEQEFGGIDPRLMPPEQKALYQARRDQLLQQLAPQYQVDPSSAVVGATPSDPTASASGRATPDGVSFLDMQ